MTAATATTEAVQVQPAARRPKYDPTLCKRAKFEQCDKPRWGTKELCEEHEAELKQRRAEAAKQGLVVSYVSPTWDARPPRHFAHTSKPAPKKAAAKAEAKPKADAKSVARHASPELAQKAAEKRAATRKAAK